MDDVGISHARLVDGASDGAFQLVQPLAASQWTAVYGAWDVSAGTNRVIKLAIGDSWGNGRTLVQTEAAILSELCRVPWVPQFVAAFDDPRQPFCVSEALVGIDLETALQGFGERADGRAIESRDMTRLQALVLAVDMASAVSAVHDRGVIHRDVRCANFMVT
jgi:serine/threonine protein kinase